MNGCVEMDIQQLKYFQMVAKLEHMTKASVELNVSQPALSKAISQLEKEIGAPLFERVGRSIRLNRYGKIFLEKTMPISDIYEEARQEIRDLIMPNAGTVSVGFTHSIGTHLLPRVVKDFRQLYPNVRFEFNQHNSLHLLHDLEIGKCDLCIIPQTNTTVDLKWKELWREEVFVIVPNNHPLAQFEEINLTDIGNEEIVTIKEGNSLRQIQTQLFKKVGIDPAIVFEAEEFHTVVSFVEAGFGVALLPNMQKIDGYQVKRLHVTDVSCERRLGLARMNGRYLPEITKVFADFLQSKIK